MLLTGTGAARTRTPVQLRGTIHSPLLVVQHDGGAPGPLEGRPVVVLEDTSTTGGSALTAVEGVRYLYAFGKDELGLD